MNFGKYVLLLLAACVSAGGTVGWAVYEIAQLVPPATPY
jgi:hypothetical protein